MCFTFLLSWQNPLLCVHDKLVIVEWKLYRRVGDAAVVEVALKEVEAGALIVHEL